MFEMKNRREISSNDLRSIKIQQASNLIKHMYDNSDSWTTSLLCIELAHNIARNYIKPMKKKKEIEVQTEQEDQSILYKWIFSN